MQLVASAAIKFWRERLAMHGPRFLNFLLTFNNETPFLPFEL
jgi:hypothetical protein